MSSADLHPSATRKYISKKAINNPDDLVREIAEGIALASNGRVELLPDANVLRRTSVEPGKVVVVAGGGSGHEPMYQGLIGRGFCDAVACGNISAAPSPDIILAATQSVHQGAGVLYLQGNYAGDNMNFDIAAELAEEEGIQTRIVRMADDISLPVELGRRGVAASFFSVKIAGAACLEGATLEEAARIAQGVADNARSLSVAFSPGTSPETGEAMFDIADDEIEIGMGAHGEKGVATHKMLPADELVDLMLDRLIADFPLARGDRVALLINDLGATTMMELLIVNRRVHHRLQEEGVAIFDTWIGPYCTTQEMAGFSLSLLRLDEERERLLSCPASNESHLKA